MVSDSLATLKQSLPDIVLILVLMEYGLWLNMFRTNHRETKVLILVLMEYGLWLSALHGSREDVFGLNPCSNGIWSLTKGGARNRCLQQVLILVLMEYGLWLFDVNFTAEDYNVLILVLMEYGLWHDDAVITDCLLIVLILVLMEYGLWPLNGRLMALMMFCLNPCSNGIWSLTRRTSWTQRRDWRS